MKENVAEIVASYLKSNPLPVDQLPALISTVYGALQQVGKPSEPVQATPTPAVPIRRSVTDVAIVCLECGYKGKVLKRHLAGHNLSPPEYKARWGLAADYPLVAPQYAQHRSALAKELGLGKRRKAPSKRSRRQRATSAGN